MDAFHNLSLKNCIALLYIVRHCGYDLTSEIRRRYCQRATNFEETTEFLLALHVIEFDDKRIKLSDEYILALGPASDEIFAKVLIKNRIAEDTIRSSSIYASAIQEYLGLFEWRHGNYELKPSLEVSLQYSSTRNFLIELEQIEFNRSNEILKFVGKPEYVLTEPSDRIRTDAVTFERVLLRRREIGSQAELVVLNYELRRLDGYPDLKARIEHTSLHDVGAGYDILSYDPPDESTTEAVPRYIEVKAVPYDDLRFYWSRNEISLARRHGHCYCLYLIPFVHGSLEIDELEIVRDPFQKVFSGDEWICTPESYVIRKK